MENILELISQGGANIKIELSGSDLLNFCNQLISRACGEVATVLQKEKEDKLLSRDEVKHMCGVCDATLWHWNRRGYLKTVKVGNKARYHLSDVKRVLGQSKGKEGSYV